MLGLVKVATRPGSLRASLAGARRTPSRLGAPAGSVGRSEAGEVGGCPIRRPGALASKGPSRGLPAGWEAGRRSREFSPALKIYGTAPWASPTNTPAKFWQSFCGATFSSCGNADAHRGTLTALKSLPLGPHGAARTARRRAAAAAAGSPQATLAFQNSPGRGLRCRAAAAAAARGLPTHSGARRAGARAPTTGDAGAEIIRGPSGRALTAPRRARAAAAAARGRPTHTPPRGGRARALPQLGRGRSPQLEKRTPQYFAAKGPRPHLSSTQVRSQR